jgi:CrcB protein
VNAALLVFLGGGLGSLARYGVGRLLHPGSVEGFPWPTFVVNVVGSLALGVLVGFAAQREASEALRTFLAVGVLGGFTTYSTFNLDTLALFDQRGALVAGGYVVATVTVCLAAGWCGGWAARQVWA